VTLEQCLNDWLQTLTTQAESTVIGYRIMVRHLTEQIGKVKLVELKVRDVQFALGKLAERLPTRSVRLARMILIQAIRNAMVNDLVVRNVADLTDVPTGQPGRPSRSLNLEQALAVLDAAKGERLWPYVAVSMLGGIRTEEARVLRWSEVDLEAGTVAGTGRHVSFATPSFRSFRILAYRSSRSRTRWATPAPGPPRSCTGTSSGR
jgi:integrase